MLFSQNRQHADDKRTEYIDEKGFEPETRWTRPPLRSQSDQVPKHRTGVAFLQVPHTDILSC